MPEMSVDRQIPSCLPGELNGMSVVDRMLEIAGNYAMGDNRANTSDDWFRHLKCLSRHPHNKKVLKRAVRDPVNLAPRDYVAVSYSFESAFKSLEKTTLSFEIRGPKGGFIKKVKTRDIVLSRVLKYAKAVRTKFFWIDQECFDREHPEQHQAAMDSMDLVYKHSRYPVALLEITFGSGEVDLMGVLMSRVQEWPRKADSMVKMLRHVQKDRWWDRAWTFQEEYLAEKKMKLLIRHNVRRGRYIHPALGGIEGEVCVPATKFRERATDFLQDLISKDTTSEELQKDCESLLDTFRRYNVIAETIESATGRAMSSSVFGDLERRKITESYDFLPIAANVCDYDVRLRSDRLAKTRSHSVGLCALTMYLMNGEIFHNDNTITAPTSGMNLSKYLDAISFDKFRPPSVPHKLSWLKRCRLWPAEVSEEGVVTSGYLWRVDEQIETEDWDRVENIENCSKPSRLRTYQRHTLERLMKELGNSRIRAILRKKLVRYLEGDSKRVPSEARAYMNVMAEVVVEAIRTRKNLYLATLEGSPHACAIFVLDPKDIRSNLGVEAGVGAVLNVNTLVGSSVFTSWSDTTNVVTGRRRICHVSLTVEVAETLSKPKAPLITNTGWINGLAFYDNVSPQSTVVRYSEIWHQKVGVEQPKSAKRRQSSEHLRVSKSRRVYE
jgi:arginine repressor